MAYQAYVHCNYCDKVLGVEIPSEESRNPVPVECQLCLNILFVQTGQSSSSTSSASTQQLPPPQEHFTVKPPEINHRPATKYNEFVREETKRIKDAHPGISHVDAFSAASKNERSASVIRQPSGQCLGCTATLNEET